MKRAFFVVLLCTLLGTFIRSAAAGNIFIDENFEGAQAFVNWNYPVIGAWDATDNPPPPDAGIIAKKGILLRAFDTSVSNKENPVINNTGSVVTARHFLGSKCLQLASNQSVNMSPSATYVGAETGEIRFFQFALGADAASAALPVGTVIGHYKSDWSIVTTDTIECSMVLNFQVNSTGGIDIYCPNTSSIVGSFQPGAGPGPHWALVSVIQDIRPFPVAWINYDPLTTTYKGPVHGDEPTSFPTVQSGMLIFVNSKSGGAEVLADQIGPGWGNDFADDPPGVLNSREITWEIKAMNGGTLFIDDLYWDVCGHKSITEGFSQEEAARMKDFNQATNETSRVNEWRELD
ncbi:MAG: hypothetical protein WCK47_12240 [bacterium]|nr:hypothetical protein [Candidatus Sumerlaeota bacterium]